MPRLIHIETRVANLAVLLPADGNALRAVFLALYAKEITSVHAEDRDPVPLLAGLDLLGLLVIGGDVWIEGLALRFVKRDVVVELRAAEALILFGAQTPLGGHGCVGAVLALL